MLASVSERASATFQSRTQFEVSVQDPSAVEVLEAGYDLFEVISNFWFGERVSGFPDVCQALRRHSNE